MKLHVFTIALDAMPYIARHLPILEASGTDFHWHIVHGAANNTGSTQWCGKQQPRFSRDGTAEYINSLQPHPRVSLYQQQWWQGGKDEMVNAPLGTIKEECVLMQIDSDEVWTSENIRQIVGLFGTLDVERMQFYCRYFVGPDLIITGENAYGNQDYEWYRAWRFKPGQKFISHEPPVLENHTTPKGLMTRQDTLAFGLTFDHYAYALPHQVAFKEQFYNYAGALRHWRRLQENTTWPADITKFFPWAKKGTVEKLK